jgi:hypothetical protein
MNFIVLLEARLEIEQEHKVVRKSVDAQEAFGLHVLEFVDRNRSNREWFSRDHQLLEPFTIPRLQRREPFERTVRIEKCGLNGNGLASNSSELFAINK